MAGLTVFSKWFKHRQREEKVSLENPQLCACPHQVGTAQPHRQSLFNSPAHLVGWLTENRVVVIDVHDLEVHGDLSGSAGRAIVGGPDGEVQPLHLLIVHCPVGHNLP